MKWYESRIRSTPLWKYVKIVNKVMRVKDKVDLFQRDVCTLFASDELDFSFFLNFSTDFKIPSTECILLFHRERERNTAWNQSVKDESTKVAASRVVVPRSRVFSGITWIVPKVKEDEEEKKEEKGEGGGRPVDILVMPEARWGEEAEANSPLPRRRKAWSVPLLCLRLLLSSAVSLAC